MIGQKIIHLDTVDSTNNYTANLQKQGKIQHGTVILADEQTAGRGQRGATWTSNAGENLLLSLFVAPDNLSVTNQTVLTQFAALSCVFFLRKIGISALIKWPNDIYVNDRKLAGILIENTLRSTSISESIIGIGLNVNQQAFGEVNGTSIALELNQQQQPKEVLFSWLNEMNELWKLVQVGAYEKLAIAYKEHLYLKDETAVYEDKMGVFSGIIRDVDDQGFLIIQRETDLLRYDLKEIKLVGRNKL